MFEDIKGAIQQASELVDRLEATRAENGGKGSLRIRSNDPEVLRRLIQVVGKKFEPRIDAHTPNIGRLMAGRYAVEVVDAVYVALCAHPPTPVADLPESVFIPPTTAMKPALFAELEGKAISSAAERLAIEVASLEARLATLLGLPDREVPFVPRGTAPAAVRALRDMPSSEAAQKLAIQVEGLLAAQAQPAGAKEPEVSTIFRTLLSRVDHVLRILTFTALAKLRPATGNKPTTPAPAFESPASLTELYELVSRWHQAHDKQLAEASDEQKKYQEGKAHALVHVLDVLTEIGRSGYELAKRDVR